MPSSVQLDGYVDFYGACAVGWIICGWIIPDWDSSHDTPEIEIEFTDGNVTGQAMMVLYRRADVAKMGHGFIIALPSESWVVGDFVHVTIAGARRSFTLQPSSTIQRLSDEELLQRAKMVVGSGPVLGRKSRLLGLLSRSSYKGESTVDRLKWPVFMEIDETFFAPPSGVVLRGWFLDPFGIIESIRVRTSDAAQSISPHDWVRILRPDVIGSIGTAHGVTNEDCGFVAYAPDVFVADETLYIELETKDGELAYKNIPKPRRRGISAIETILSEIHVRYGDLASAFNNIIGPVVSAINADRLAAPRRVKTITYGPEPEYPRSSIIVPLYGRIDFMEYQLAFLADTFSGRDEILYVLDDPRKVREAETLAQASFARFKVPFKLLVLDQNLGFGPANNVGIAHARGTHVCLLNSDVIPCEPRWLDLMVETLESDENIGIVGALLLFEDGSVQHEGCEFVALPEFGGWHFPIHTNKGRTPRIGQRLKEVEAVTAACMVARLDLLLRLDGFDECYAIGDFEDSDLCMRVRAEGLKCVVDTLAKLYHLERQSQNAVSGSWRMNLTLFNAWQHEKRWFG
jgi:GT2 family glycosyltransferase